MRGGGFGCGGGDAYHANDDVKTETLSCGMARSQIDIGAGHGKMTKQSAEADSRGISLGALQF